MLFADFDAVQIGVKIFKSHYLNVWQKVLKLLENCYVQLFFTCLDYMFKES